MLKKCLKKSVNIIADTIVKTIGTKYNKRPANYHTASLAIRSILKKKGIDSGNATIIDGSG
jgi:D-alanyl-D-alanine carboxypeptidase/D-alanyl-D-alanine-endopeptidase (penicillin-binding protein 4)